MRNPLIKRILRELKSDWHKIIVLGEGKVIEEGRPEELLTRKDSVFARMYALQKDSEKWSLG